MTSSLILASASPQRKTLLASLGLTFDVISSSVDESQCTEKDPLVRSQVLARLKAEDVAVKHSNACVIGCDTLVVSSDGTLLEKPKDASDARIMLRKHSGATCLVHSAVCVMTKGKSYEGVSTSKVTFKKLSATEMDWWIASGQWKDRSGGFQIEGTGQLMISKIEGDYSGIVGLPIFVLGRLLTEAGYYIFE